MEDLPERSTYPSERVEADDAEAKQAAEPRALQPEVTEASPAEPTRDAQPEPTLEAEDQSAVEADAEPQTLDAVGNEPPTETLEANAPAPAAAETPEPEPAKPAAAVPPVPSGPRIADLRPGMLVDGTVTRIERYGAFVNLGLADRRDGLIHISELAPHRIRRVEDVVKVGDPVHARVVSVDLGRGRIALSLNDVLPEFDAEAAGRSNEPTMTSMAMAFEQAYSRKKEREGQARPEPRSDMGAKKRQEHETLMRRFRSGSA